MESKFFLATHYGILKPVDDTDQVATWKAQSIPTLTATEAALKVDITVFFPQPIAKLLMQQALRAAVQTVQSNASDSATTEHIIFFIRSNWKELALIAHKNNLRVGIGCLFLPEGILNWNSFDEVPLHYVPRAQFIE